MSGAAATAGPDPRLRPLRTALREVLFPPPWLAYVIRVAVATVVTLYLAFWLQLDTPYSAVTTVFIVANPVRGAIVSKSVWRLVGTLVGAIAAVIQFAVLAQSPILFDLALAVWVGLCCGASTLLKFFPSYGTVLAGYTVVIVDVGGIASPDHVLGVGLARLSVVVLGIVVTGLVFLLTQRAQPPAAFGRDLADTTVSLSNLLADVLAGESLDNVRKRRRALAARITGYEQAIVFGSADDLEVKARSLSLRLVLTDLLAALSNGLRSTLVVRETTQSEDEQEHQAANARLTEALAAVSVHAISDPARARAVLQQGAADLETIRERCSTLETLESVELARLTLTRLDTVLEDLAASAARRPQTSIRLRPYYDVRNAFRNAVRGFLAVSIACLFWYLTYWPQGPTLLAYMVPAAALLSTNPSPGAASIRFVQGTLIAVVMAVICQAIVLPRANDFVPAVLVLLVFVSPGVALQLSPKWGAAAFAYVVFFNTNLGLDNAMNFNLPALLANAEAYLVGCLGLLLTFRILLPPDPALAIRQIARAMGDEGERLAHARRLPDPRVWENIQLQRILLIAQRLDAMGSPRRGAMIEDATAGMLLGRTVMRLRDLLGADRLGPDARAAIGEALVSLRTLRNRPLERASTLADSARRVLGDDPAPDRLRAAALLTTAARLVRTHAEFFDRNSRLDSISDTAVQG